MDSNSVEVSILVAVYNAEKRLSKCIDSLLRQTLRNIQIVCVDDCSTDNSLKMLKEYALHDSRVVVVSLPENHGQAYARNMGLRLASGRYVGYCDSDDWLAEDALQKVVNVFTEHEQTDCVLMRFFLHYEGNDSERSEVYPMAPFEMLTGRQAFEYSLDWTIHGCYVARKSLYDRFPYDETCKSYSDDNTTRLHYIYSREVRQCDGTYYYRMHPDSVTHAITVRRFDVLRANESMKRQLSELNEDDSIMRRYENIRWLMLVDVYMFYHCHGHELPKADRQYGLTEMKRAWHNIDRRRIERHLYRKLGYCPMPSWTLFRLEEWLYFTLRGLMGKNQ